MVEFVEDGVVLTGDRVQVSEAIVRADAFLAFAMGEEIESVPLPLQAVAFAFTPYDIMEVGRESGCRLQKDYFNSCIRIRGTGVAKARSLVDEKMMEWSKSHFTMPVPGWALSVIVGRKGETINGIREEAGVEIDVDQDANIVTLTGEVGNIAKARAAVEKLIEENKVWVEEVQLPDDSKGSFIGKGGANIKVMQDGLEGVTVRA